METVLDLRIEIKLERISAQELKIEIFKILRCESEAQSRRHVKSAVRHFQGSSRKLHLSPYSHLSYLFILDLPGDRAGSHFGNLPEFHGSQNLSPCFTAVESDHQPV